MTEVLERVALRDREGAARYLSMTVRRLDDLRRSGAIRAVRDGNRWKYMSAALDEYIDSLPTNAA
ncbi:helix-turn-helix domain-containing protein [Mycobacteroides abscessus]|uniref:helix-turn-helix domain-containing protein n=1 Tax=Mycobacteroides abscessus TaxID=36809 RepID=UPI0009A665F9|nr:helix-turn-helix domain-containing protein [Mycobacteroides abscessus]MBN7314132.1 helix-turn-helix domain-containing protein [Mycobacteroides abscessus subsp. abscessus]SKG10684.1 Gp56 [Mycobacteroides abscessus subsp. massiliense]